MFRKMTAVALFLVSIAGGGAVAATPTDSNGQTPDLVRLLETPAHTTCTSADPLVSADELNLTTSAVLAPTACQLVVNCCRSGNANCCAVVSSVCR